ncbi:ABC transporter permease [Methanobrevibacter sp. DSM 116169]|uniref:ABC transporter permease n=1 Tax=Methanobrevibacter sp. DSM 116169 TaxID=3242727 RepID=UPI0038FD226D
MSFINLILKNPFRNKMRVFLSVSGISIGIITIIVLGAITNGLIVGAEDTLHAGGTDFLIMNSEVDANQANFLNESWNSKIASYPGVNITTPLCDGALMFDGKYLAFQGINSKDTKNLEIAIIEGRNFNDSANELIIGKVAKDRLNKTVGDVIESNGEEWKIVGVFESGDPNIDTLSYAPLEGVQKVMDEEGKISEIYVKADKGVDTEKLAKDIENKYKDNITVISSISEMAGTQNILDMLNGAKWGISLLAIIVGGIGIINTMIMSVYERTREIGVLKAVGWSRSRIIGMILGESIVITLVAGIVASILGIVFVEILNISGILSGMAPVLSVNLFIEAIVISLIVGIIGGLYPAIKASNLQPTEALRYE